MAPGKGRRFLTDSEELQLVRAYVRRALRATLGADIVRSEDGLPGHLASLLALHRIDCVLDVGANAGDFGVLLRRLGYHGKIVSFEPVEAVFRALQARSASDVNWTACKLALGDGRGVQTINVSQDLHLSSFLRPNDYGHEQFRGIGASRCETISVERLDDVFPRYVNGRSRVLLKVDTQGWDLNVFRGGEECLEDVRVVQTELSLRPIYEAMPAYTEVIAYLQERGLVMTGLFPVTRDAGMHLIEVDCVMSR